MSESETLRMQARDQFVFGEREVSPMRAKERRSAQVRGQVGRGELELLARPRRRSALSMLAHGGAAGAILAVGERDAAVVELDAAGSRTRSCNCSMWMKSGRSFFIRNSTSAWICLPIGSWPTAAQAASTAFSILWPIHGTTRGLVDVEPAADRGG